MSKYTKAIIAVVVAAFAGLTVWAVNSVPDAPDDTAPEQHVMTYDGNKITETKDGKVVWEGQDGHFQTCQKCNRRWRD